MTFTFEELETEKAVRRFAWKELLPIRSEIDRRGALPEDVGERFKAMGLLKCGFPEAYGGVNGTFTGLILSLKELAYASIVPAFMVFENFMLAYPLLQFGSERLKRAYLPPLLSMEAVGALAFTEADTGSDPVQLKTTAEKRAGGWVINGSKRFITNSSACDQAILFAKTGGNVTAFLVDSKREGYSVGKRETFLHWKAFDNGDLHLDDYFVPHDHVVGDVDQGFPILLKTEAVGKAAFCSLFVGMAERAMDLALDYANKRTHRDRPIGHKFQLIQGKLANMAAMLEAMNACLFQVSAKIDRGEDVFYDAAALKLLVAAGIKAIASDAMEIHGAYGLSEEYEVESLYRAAVSAQVVMGSLDIQRVIVAKGLLARGRYRQGA